MRSSAHRLRPLARQAVMALVGLAVGWAGAVETAPPADRPSDVPDEVGLGERLALVAWLGERKVVIADAQDLPALRLAYARLAHPLPAGGPVVPDEEWLRGEAAAELYRRFGTNPAPGATSAEIRAQLATLASAAQRQAAHDQESAQRGEPAPVHGAGASAGEAGEAGGSGAAGPSAGTGTKPRPSDESYAQKRDAARKTVGIVVGAPFPALTGQTVAGTDFSLAGWRGKVVLVDFWATWCGPCRRELPNVLATYKDYHERGFEVIGVSLDSDIPAMQRFLATQAMPWPQLCDGHGWEGPFATRFAVHAIPAAFLIGSDGNLIATDLRGAALSAAVAKALGAKP